ncbi:MAG: 7-cyano-7-deazaguanine synthase [Alphaproteobacteria bacterium]|nr:7-cyano-7-deazaguanine synthase [Alphaproteobacteria bacterium]
MISIKKIKPHGLVHCEVYVCSEEEQIPQGWKGCVIGKNIKFKLDSLSGYYLENGDDLVYDAFIVAASIEYCDYLQGRFVRKWGREFTVSIPVDNVEHWQSKPLYNSLVGALNILTGDKWNLKFRKRQFIPEGLQKLKMVFPNQAEAVLAFSDGLDSLCVSEIMTKKMDGELFKVRLGTSQSVKSPPFLSMPYNVSQNTRNNRESSGRSRGFKFSILSGVTSYLSSTPKIIITESGQGALGPALIPVAHTSVDYRNHPIFFKEMTKFLSLLFGREFIFDMPRIWNTKGETLREYIKISGDSTKWKNTRSCWMGSRQISADGDIKQCGICAACQLRRMSVHAAGLQEDLGTYIWQDLTANTFENGCIDIEDKKRYIKSFKKYAVGGMSHLRDLAELRSNSLNQTNISIHATKVAIALKLSKEEVMSKQKILLETHESEWNSFLDSLGSKSFISKWAKGGLDYAS